MFLTTLLLAGILHDRAVSLERNHVSLLDAIALVGRETGTTLAYAPEVLAAAAQLPDVTFNADRVSAESLLQRLLAGGGLKAELREGVLTVARVAAAEADTPSEVASTTRRNGSVYATVATPSAATSMAARIADDVPAAAQASSEKSRTANASTAAAATVRPSASADPAMTKLDRSAVIAPGHLTIEFHPHLPSH